ncbi:MAG: alpha-galactosidase [Treponema sp.]|nr:alpha-galactosidase [Treponema sp.]
MKVYTVHQSYHAEENSVIDVIDISKFLDVSKYPLKDAWINVGGWQSWNPGFEVEPGKKQESLECKIIKGWNQYLVFPESKFKASKNLVLGQFVCYARWENFYLCFVSAGNISSLLPPVQFIFDRTKNTVSIEIADKNNNWKRDDITAKIEIFTADSYFDCKDKLKDIFGSNHFEQIKELGMNPGGWESWYNHYANINEKLILDDLEALKSTKNIITEGNYSSLIFQVDDGWEKALGLWEPRTDRFPGGMVNIVNKIEEKHCIPGLWIAPFIVDLRCDTAAAHPQWLLRDEKGNLVPAGFNPLWGSDGTFYCWDLSQDDVLDWIFSCISKAINEWGFRYLKLDFLYAGMLYGKFANGEAAYKWYSRAIKLLTSIRRSPDGKPVFYLGCGVPFELSFKYFPLSRIGCDTLEHWENKLLKFINWNGRNSAYLNIKDTLGHAMWNQVIFANDPDVLFIRNKNCSLTEKQKLLIAYVDIMFGSQLMYSDDPTNDNSEEENLLTRAIVDINSSLKEEDWGVCPIGKDTYKIFTRDGNRQGEINLSKDNSYIRIMR